MTTPRQNQKNKNKGPARLPSGGVVFEARRHAVALTKERDMTVQALRHSNAAAAYLLSLIDGRVAIPLTEYRRLLTDDKTNINVVYEGEEAIVTAIAEPQKETPPFEPTPKEELRMTKLEPVQHVGDTSPVGNVTVTDKGSVP